MILHIRRFPASGHAPDKLSYASNIYSIYDKSNTPIYIFSTIIYFGLFLPQNPLFSGVFTYFQTFFAKLLYIQKNIFTFVSSNDNEAVAIKTKAMTKLTFTNVFIKDAKEILSLAYQLDKSATYANDFCVNGSTVTAIATVNEPASKNSTAKKFDVNVQSGIYELPTLKEHFSAFDFAL